MKTSSKELKRHAKQNLKGRYGLCIGIQLIESVIFLPVFLVCVFISFFMGMVNDPFSGGILAFWAVVCISFLVTFLIYGLLRPGIFKFYLNMSTGEKPKLSDLLFGFQNRPHHFLGLYLINILIVMVWAIPFFVVLVVAFITDFIPVMVVLLILTLLFLVLGEIITMLYLSQSMFILIESPERGAWKSLMESADMMKGNKGGLVYLYLSFFGIVLLGYCSYGIGYLWIYPYIYATMAEYYLSVRNQQASFEPVWTEENYL